MVLQSIHLIIMTPKYRFKDFFLIIHREEYMNVVFVGMPGAGKTTLSEPVARRLNKTCVELDEMIEERMDMPLQAYIDTYGNEAFKDKERQILMDIFQSCENCVISPPGSLIYYSELLEYIRENASRFVVFYLKCELDVVLKRTNHFENRGVLLDKSLPKPYQGLYEERTPLYEAMSHHVLDANHSSEDNARIIVEVLDNHYTKSI